MVVNFFPAVDSLRGRLEKFRLIHRQGEGDVWEATIEKLEQEGREPWRQEGPSYDPFGYW